MNKFFNPEITSWSSLVQRPLYSLDSVKDVVDGIFNNVELYGDKSLIDYTNKFDNVKLTDLKINAEKISNSEKNIDKELKDAINIALTIFINFMKIRFINLKKLRLQKVFYVGKKKELLKMLVYIFQAELPLCFPPF